jgi:hypothetical protein
VVSRSSSLKSKVFEHASNALTRIEGKVFDAHLGVDKFNLRGLDADRLLFFRFDIRSRVVAMLDQVFEHD